MVVRNVVRSPVRAVVQSVFGEGESFHPFQLFRSGANLDADAETNPASGTFTVTLQRRIGGTAWIPVEDGYTTDQTKQIVSPGEYRLIASGTSGGSAVTFLEMDK